MPAAADGDRKVVFARELKGRDDVLAPRGPNYRGGPTIDHSVPDAPGIVVPVVAGKDDLAGEGFRESAQGAVRAHGH